jgi:hypothetical protein
MRNKAVQQGGGTAKHQSSAGVTLSFRGRESPSEFAADLSDLLAGMFSRIRSIRACSRG